MSKMMTGACLNAGFFPCAGIPGKHARIRDLVHVLSLPLMDREGGCLHFYA